MNIIINPGTKSSGDETLINAEELLNKIHQRFIEEFVSERSPGGDWDGWFEYLFKKDGRELRVSIPGDAPETTMLSKPFVSKRLYVDGNSWLFCFAMGFIGDFLQNN